MIDTNPTFTPAGRLAETARPERAATTPSVGRLRADPSPARPSVPDLAHPSRLDPSPTFPGRADRATPTSMSSPQSPGRVTPSRLATTERPQRATPTPAPTPVTGPRGGPPDPSAHDHPLAAQAPTPTPVAPLMAIRQSSTAPSQVSRAPAAPGPYLPTEYSPHPDWSNEYGYVITDLNTVRTFLH